MKLGTDRILTTHTGSLPRSATLTDLLLRPEQGADIDEVALARVASADVNRVVRGRLNAGYDRERVLAGTDCGFGMFAGSDTVAGDVGSGPSSPPSRKARVSRPPAPGSRGSICLSAKRDPEE